MNKEVPEKRGVTTKEAQEILAKNGIKISDEKAEKLLDFLYFLAKLTVNQIVNNKVTFKEENEKSRFIHKSKH